MKIEWLEGLGLDKETVEKIAQANRDSLEGVIGERDRYKKDAEKLVEVQRELDEMKEDVAKRNGENADYEEKYNKLKREFNMYKEGVEKEKAHVAKSTAYRQILKDAHVSEKRIDSVLKVSDVDSIEFDEKGNVKDADKLKETISKDWADFIETDEKHGADSNNHPDGYDTDPSNMSMEDYIKFRKG